MGLGALTHALHRDVRPSLIVVTDVNQERLDRAAHLFPVEEAKTDGIELHFINTGNMADPAAELLAVTGDTGFDDVFCYTPVASVVELSSAVLGRDGCLNFFADPTTTSSAPRCALSPGHPAGRLCNGTICGQETDALLWKNEGRRFFIHGNC